MTNPTWSELTKLLSDHKEELNNTFKDYISPLRDSSMALHRRLDEYNKDSIRSEINNEKEHGKIVYELEKHILDNSHDFEMIMTSQENMSNAVVELSKTLSKLNEYFIKVDKLENKVTVGIVSSLFAIISVMVYSGYNFILDKFFGG